MVCFGEHVLDARRTQNERCSGFTLIEALSVALIVSLLIALLLPTFIEARKTRERIACAASQHQLGVAVVSYTLSSFGELPEHHGGGPLPMDTYAMLNPGGKAMNLGLVIGYVNQASTFYCLTQTQDRSPDIAQDSPLNKWNKGKGIAGKWLNSAYAARPKDGSARWTLQNYDNKVIYSDFIGVDGWEGKGNGRFGGDLLAPHQSEGYNRLFGDGSAQWTDAGPLNQLRPIDKVVPDATQLNSYFKLLDVLP